VKVDSHGCQLWSGCAASDIKAPGAAPRARDGPL
jgi:hypothetical protein